MYASRILWFWDAWLGASRVQDFGLGAPRVESFDGRHRASDAGLSPSGGLGQPRARTKGLITTFSIEYGRDSKHTASHAHQQAADKCVRQRVMMFKSLRGNRRPLGRRADTVTKSTGPPRHRNPCLAVYRRVGNYPRCCMHAKPLFWEQLCNTGWRTPNGHRSSRDLGVLPRPWRHRFPRPQCLPARRWRDAGSEVGMGEVVGDTACHGEDRP